MTLSISLVSDRQANRMPRGGVAIVDLWTLDDVINSQGAVPAQLVAVVEPTPEHAREALFAGLYLRNAGHTVLVGNWDDVDIGMIHRLDAFMHSALAEGRPIGHEMFIIEEALPHFDSAEQYVREFEQQNFPDDGAV